MSRDPMYFLGKCVNELLTLNKNYISREPSASWRFRGSCIIYITSISKYFEIYNLTVIVTKYYTNKGVVITQRNYLT